MQELFDVLFRICSSESAPPPVDRLLTKPDGHLVSFDQRQEDASEAKTNNLSENRHSVDTTKVVDGGPE
jgi:hypothetical protein